MNRNISWHCFLQGTVQKGESASYAALKKWVASMWSRKIKEQPSQCPQTKQVSWWSSSTQRQSHRKSSGLSSAAELTGHRDPCSALRLHRISASSSKNASPRSRSLTVYCACGIITLFWTFWVAAFGRSECFFTKSFSSRYSEDSDWSSFK